MQPSPNRYSDRFPEHERLDALTWNFSRAFTYNFNVVFLKAGARFIVGRYARTFEPYFTFLQRIEEKNVIDEGLLT